MKLKWIILLILNLFLIKEQYAQTNEFKHFTVNEGLSQSVINCILQDSEGYMWFGSQNGLNKFNGYEFEKYLTNPNDSNSLRDSWIFDITEDLNGNIWIATKKGLNKLNKKTNKISFIKLENKDYTARKEAIYGLCIASSGEIVVNTPPFIHFINTKTHKVKSYNSGLQYDDASFDQNIPIIEGEKGEFWIASTKALSLFNYQNQKFTNFASTQSQYTINSNNISALFCDSEKNIWIGSNLGLNKFNSSTQEFTSFLNSGELGNGRPVYIHSITQDKNKNLWLGTNALGLIKFTEEKGFYVFKHTNSQESISHDVIYSLFLDKSENLWIGTLLSADKTDLKPKKFKLYRKSSRLNSINLLDNVISSIYKDENENVWIGNWGKGLNVFNRKTGEVEHFTSTLSGRNHISNDFVHVIFRFSQNETWIGTRNGIEIYNKKDEKFILFNEYYKNTNIPDLEGVRVNRIIKDKNKNIWLASHNGVYKLNFNENKYTHYSKEFTKFQISDNQVYTLIEDSDGFIWLATADGLDRINVEKNEIKHFKSNGNNTNSLCDNYTIALCEDADKNIWIGTQNGINKYIKETSTFIYYGLEHGIPKKIIYEIVMDKFNNLWITSGDGIFLYDSKNKTFEEFGLSDGLQSLEFNLNAKHQSPNGEMFLGGMNGFNSFFPDSLHKNNYKPNLVFTSFEKKSETQTSYLNVFNGSEIELNSKEIEFTIEFSALEFTNSSKNKYAYQMEGISKAWIEIENRRFVPFQKLPAGDYVFSVRGSNNDGIWNEEAISLKITIFPPWWKSNFAYLSYIILGVLAVYLLIIAREKQLKNERDVLERKVVARTEEINAQKEEIQRKNSNITASINYASRIQRAVLPQYEAFNKIVPNNLLFFRPRDIVSGDFFWFSEVKVVIDNAESRVLQIIIAADSTGHGVPGAFVTVIGNNILDDIVNKQKIYKPHEILYKLDEEITKTFKKKSDNISVDDGMDISIITLDKKANKIMFAGAKNPLCLVRSNEIQVIKGSRSAIGGYFAKKKVFESHDIEIQKGDAIYIFSDGYQDQFGGEKNYKFLARNFRNLLVEIHTETSENQLEILTNRFNRWRGVVPQTDDIIILGLFF